MPEKYMDSYAPWNGASRFQSSISPKVDMMELEESKQKLLMEQLRMFGQMHGIPANHLWDMYQNISSQQDRDENKSWQDVRGRMPPLQETLRNQGQWDRIQQPLPYMNIRKGNVF